MKAMIAAGLVAMALLTGTARAAEPNAQQSKMVTCNKEAGDRKGEARKAFMKKCLSVKKTAQQQKMKVCNKQATGKTGNERKAFMKRCLSH